MSRHRQETSSGLGSLAFFKRESAIKKENKGCPMTSAGGRRAAVEETDFGHYPRVRWQHHSQVTELH